VEFYVQSKSGTRAQNRINQIRLEGETAPLDIAAGMLDAGIKSARLDLSRAVAHAGDTTVRVLADRNVFLIETDKEVSLEEIKAPELPAAEQGARDGVQWLHAILPGDMDYAGMEYALAVESSGTLKAVSLVTSRDTRQNCRDEAIHLARGTVATPPATLVAQHEAVWVRYPWCRRQAVFLRPTHGVRQGRRGRRQTSGARKLQRHCAF
jgi:hypothetical protein